MIVAEDAGYRILSILAILVTRLVEVTHTAFDVMRAGLWCCSASHRRRSDTQRVTQGGLSSVVREAHILRIDVLRTESVESE